MLIPGRAATLLTACLLLLAAVALPASPAAAADGVGCNPIALVCDIELTDPPTDPVRDPETGVTAGPAQCVAETGDGYVQIPCVSGDGHWSNESQCYWEPFDPATDPPRTPPAGADSTGAWYLCVPYGAGAEFVVAIWHWLTAPPPGLGLTPGQAAARIVETMTFHSIQIGMAPEPNPEWGYRRGHVGIPVWLWAADRGTQDWGPYTVTATLGGQTITVTANVTAVTWDLGDGTTITCGAGTPYQPTAGLADSPNCGHRYQRTSDTQPDGFYTVTATSQWAIDWAGGGQSGTIPLTAVSSTPLQVQELQSVNVTAP